jgi:cytochrome P450
MNGQEGEIGMTLNAPVSGGCPITHGFTPFEPSYLSDPYPYFNALREEMPVAYSPEYDLYLVSRFDDIVAVLKNRDVFSAANSTIAFSKIAPAAQAILASGFPRKPTFSNADAPRHTAMRSAASKCLTHRRWKSVQPVITGFVEKRLEAIKGQDIIDLGADVIFPTTSYAGFSLLGFPEEDIPMLFSWCGKRVLMTYGELGEDDQLIAAQQLVDFWSYCRDFVRMREKNPVDDLPSDLIATAKASGGVMTIEDVDNMIYSLSLASHETTANAMLNGFHRLMQNRDVWNELVADHALIPGAVEELMRFDSPTITHRRLTKMDTEIGGVPIPAGATVMLMFGAGNHDPERFPDPETLDIRRKNAIEHLAFGKNWHFCLGAPLARFEIALVLGKLLEAMPNMTAVEDQLTYNPVVLFRGPEKLLVRPQ